ncbi:hypothetical protein B0H14DRAFT_3677757 [Mycena olivaceomarginata]|nr:hypothetical protein B0H14DRAFT_3677757 [Mycena olivaceomarginata]
MSLVSKTTRFLAIPHIFSTIQFACVEDFARWLDILGRTPILGTVVKAVKFFEADRDWLRRWRRLKSAAPLRACTAPPVIPALPSVRSVEWYGMSMSYDNSNSVAMAVAHMVFFHNVDKHCLCGMEFGFAALASLLGACGQLKSLSFHAATAEEGGSDSEIDSGTADRPRQALFDLAALEELVVIDSKSAHPEGDGTLLRLLQYSRPRRLQTLSFGDVYLEEPCITDPAFPYTAKRRVSKTFDRLPAFVALESLTLWLRPRGRAEAFINGIPSAPHLTRLLFRVALYDEVDEADATILTRKFPSCQQIEFHFCIPRDSDMHFRRGLRRSREQRLRARLEANGAGISDLLRVEWFDGAYNSVTYNETNGKRLWKWLTRYAEPETESSDCESNADLGGWDLDGNSVIRAWTEEDQREYRREMLAECGGYSDEERDSDK